MPVSTTTTITSAKAQQILPAASLVRLQMLEERIAYRYSQDRIDQGLDENGNEIEQQSDDDSDDDLCSSNHMNKADDPIQFQWLLRTLAKLEECAPPEEEEEEQTEGEEEEGKDTTTTSITSRKTTSFSSTTQDEEYRIAHDRLVERVTAAMAHLCGRAASGAVTRTWKFNTHPFPKSIQIHDPSFIGGDVGFKTFGSAYLLSKHIAHGHLPQLEPWVADNDSGVCVATNFDGGNTSAKKSTDYPRILEIGSGTGLTGFTASMYTPPWAPKVILSDYHPNVLSTLEENCRRNKLEHRITIQSLDWRHVLELVEQEQQYKNDSQGNTNNNGPKDDMTNLPEPESMDIILGAEVVYDHGHAKLVAHVVDRFLKQERRGPTPRDRPAFHLMFPIRPTHTDVIAELDYWMDKLDFVDVRQHREWGREDGETVFQYHWREYVRKEHL
ncbi:hypothetical protein BGW42_004687 [Actinomortierella wolfii]|nr:hypothetical protein BGW42_004687 [Actinomortierella wolfii]